MAKLPVSLSKAAKAWKEVASNIDQAATLVLAGNAELVALAQAKFSAGGTVPATWVGALSEVARVAPAADEILLVLIEPADEPQVRAELEAASPKGGVVLAVKQTVSGARLGHPFERCIRVDFADDTAGWRLISTACAELAGEHVAGLGRRYPAVRAAAAQRIITRTAGQNALVGVLFIVPGADMPAMTLNQLKMVLYISGLYGAEIGPDRALEILAVVAAGFGYRGLARKIARHVPGFGWIYRAIIGYLGTVAVGMAAVKYFEHGAPASTSKLMALVGNFRS